jgi:adenosylmethionine-8-amino-7-oxononanoate aminotransferase
MARQFQVERGRPEKYKVISRWTSYHGNTLGALALSGHTGRRRYYLPLIQHTPHIAPAYCYRCPFGLDPERCELECALDLEKAILYEGPDSVSAFIAEPIVGATAGALVPRDGYFQRIREICDRYDVLLIVDEVMTGMGRTGRNFAHRSLGVTPDMIVVGKGIEQRIHPYLCGDREGRDLHDDSRRFRSVSFTDIHTIKTPFPVRLRVRSSIIYWSTI